jgi:hypothetical protein
MQRTKNAILLGCLLAGAGLAPLAAHASPVVSMELTGVAGASMDGVYTDPYYAKVDPTGKDNFSSASAYSLAIYCDDFYDDVQSGQTWQAQITNLGSLSGTSALQTVMFDTNDASQQEKDYMTAAWLVEQIGGQTYSQTADEQMSWAIWGIFDPSALNSLKYNDPGNYSAAEGYLSSAQTAIIGLTPGDFSNVNVYTPLEKTPGCASSQEYLSYSPIDTPEPSTLSLAAVGLAAIGFAVRRRRRTVTA